LKIFCVINNNMGLLVESKVELKITTENKRALGKVGTKNYSYHISNLKKKHSVMLVCHYATRDLAIVF